MALSLVPQRKKYHPDYTGRYADYLANRGELIEGYNAAGCKAHHNGSTCGRVVEWESVDLGGPDCWQPQGFQCASCGEWSANDCGKRDVRICGVCLL